MRTALALTALVFCLSQAAFASDVSALWAKRCKSCHGVDGKADTKMGHKHKVPDMTSAKFKADPKHTDAWMKDAIANGVKNTKMKAYKSRLSPAEIASLVAYVRTLQAK